MTLPEFTAESSLRQSNQFYGTFASGSDPGGSGLLVRSGEVDSQQLGSLAFAGFHPFPLFCLPPLSRCGFSCKNLASDPFNCGGCGHKCTPPSLCARGHCIPRWQCNDEGTCCPPGQTPCGTECCDPFLCNTTPAGYSFCCAPDTTPCGYDCCDPSLGQHCCGFGGSLECCDQWQGCNEDTGMCCDPCGGDCCDPGEQCNTASGTCCPSGTSPCGSSCCGPGE